MQVELNKIEVELIDKALEVWEKEAHSAPMFTSLVSAMLCPKEERDGEKLRREKDFRDADVEARNRRTKSILLRAKLIQALARESEHEVSADQ